MRTKRIFTEDEVKLIDTMYHEGYTYKEICKKLGCRDKPLRRFLNENGYTKRSQESLRNNGGVKKSRKHFFNERYFQTIDTEDKAYWLGFWYADGNVRYGEGQKGGTKGGTAEITLKASDKNHLIKMLECMGADEDYPINDRTIKLNGKSYQACRISFHSIDMCHDLEDQGCVPAKSLILEPPQKVPDNLVHHFVRGYFDGDGAISFNEETNKGGASLLGTESVLNYIKEKSDLYETAITHDRKGNKAYMLSIGSNSNSIIFYNYIYNNAITYLDRKKKKFDKFIEYLKISHPKLYRNTFSEDSLIKHKSHGVPVAKIDANYNIVCAYNNYGEACKTESIKEYMMTECVNDKYKRRYIKGYYWIKYEDYYYNKDRLKEYMVNRGYIGL